MASGGTHNIDFHFILELRTRWPYVEMITIEKDIPLAPHTTFHIGGKADFFVSVHTVSELRDAIVWAKDTGVPITVIGGGSNIVVADSGIRGLVIHIAIESFIATEDTDTVSVRVGAGMVLDVLIAETVSRSWWGLENLSSIPGTVGAVPVQNVGAYGVEVSELIRAVSVLDTRTFTERTLTKDECGFGYRDSCFKHDTGKHLIVTEVEFVLSKKPTPRFTYKDLAKAFPEGVATQRAIREAVIAIRAKKFPNWHEVGTAGSFFKNPLISEVAFTALQKRFPELPGYVQKDGMVKIPLGFVLDKILHLKGMCEGNVCCYEQQALVLVNKKDATAEDVDACARMIEKKVFDTIGITIEREVTFLK